MRASLLCRLVTMSCAATMTAAEASAPPPATLSLRADGAPNVAAVAVSIDTSDEPLGSDTDVKHTFAKNGARPAAEAHCAPVDVTAYEKVDAGAEVDDTRPLMLRQADAFFCK